MKIQESLANSFFIWLPVGIDLNVSGTENILNYVSLKQPSSVHFWDRTFSDIQRYWIQNLGWLDWPSQNHEALWNCSISSSTVRQLKRFFCSCCAHFLLQFCLQNSSNLGSTSTTSVILSGLGSQTTFQITFYLVPVAFGSSFTCVFLLLFCWLNNAGVPSDMRR